MGVENVNRGFLPVQIGLNLTIGFSDLIKMESRPHAHEIALKKSQKKPGKPA